jgi:DNA-binding CsgD family transcriptional regulator
MVASFGALIWIALLGARFWGAPFDMADRLVAVAYPTMDLAVLAVTVRLGVGMRRRVASYFLLLAAASTVFLSNLAYALEALGSGYQPGSLLDMGYMVSWVLLAAAGLHSSRHLTFGMEEVGAHRPHREVFLFGATAAMTMLAITLRGIAAGEVAIVFLVLVCGVIFTTFTVRLVRFATDLQRDNAILRGSRMGQETRGLLAHLLTTIRRDVSVEEPDPGLTERELTVLRLLRSDLSLRQMGEALFVSHNTVKTHTRSIYRKLGVGTRAEAVAVARDRGLLG